MKTSRRSKSLSLSKQYFEREDISFQKNENSFRKLSLPYSCREKEIDIKETFIFVPKKKRKENFYFTKRGDQMETLSLKKLKLKNLKNVYLERNPFVLNKYI